MILSHSSQLLQVQEDFSNYASGADARSPVGRLYTPPQVRHIILLRSETEKEEPGRYLLLRPASRRGLCIPVAAAPRGGGGDAFGPPPLEGSPAAARSVGRRL